jgi:DNA-binding transcriptional ArsR family regulator
MSAHAAIANTAALVADPTRASILLLLVDGRARPAGELAYAAGVSAQTASSHLAKLLDGGMLAVEREGRHRYYRLANEQVVATLEHLAAISPPIPVRRRAPNREAERLQFARCCYDHLAGALGVQLTKAMVGRGYLAGAEDKRYEVTTTGEAWFDSLGVAVGRLKPGPHGLARQCLDWTEREHHLAGPLGTRFLSVACDCGWLRRDSDSRAIRVTSDGWSAFAHHLDVRQIDVERALA